FRVRVKNERGEFVRYLTREEFRIFEDDSEQDVSLFSLVDLPFSGPPPPVFGSRRVERDVTTNESADDGRLYVIVIDDAVGGLPRDSEVGVRAAAHTFIEQHLTESDQVAIVSTNSRPDLAQEFTSNRRRMLQTI